MISTNIKNIKKPTLIPSKDKQLKTPPQVPTKILESISLKIGDVNVALSSPNRQIVFPSNLLRQNNDPPRVVTNTQRFEQTGPAKTLLLSKIFFQTINFLYLMKQNTTLIQV